VTNPDDIRISVLKETVYKVQALIHPLCNIREDANEIKRSQWEEEIERIKADTESDQMLLFIGPFSSGKSTFVNALLGANILPTAEAPCTSVVLEISFTEGGGHKGKLFKYGGNVEESNFDEIMELVNGPRGSVGRVAHIHHIELLFDVTEVEDWERHPLNTLKSLGVKVVDCPGYGSPYATKEDSIEEYIRKASFTFWMSPADKFGGRLAARKLSDIKKKTTALIPVLTMADKLVDETQYEQAREDFYEHLAPLFPRNKEPRFVSAYKYLKAVELAKKLDDDGKEPLTKEQRAKLEKEIGKLQLEAGLENIFGDMIHAGEKRQVAQAKIISALNDLNTLLKDMDDRIKNELSHWTKEAEKAGWSGNDQYKKLNEIKREVDAWVKAQAKMVASNLETAMIKKIADYIMQVKGKVESSQVQYIVKDVWDKEINKHKGNWAQFLHNKYKQYADYTPNISDDTKIKPPDLVSITANLTNTLLSIMEAFRFAGPQSALTASAGAALMITAPAAANLALIGGALSTLMLFAGPVIIAVAVIPLIPLIKDLTDKRNAQYRKQMEDKLREWMKTLDAAPTIQVLLNKESEQLYNSYRDQFDVAVGQAVRNREECVNLKEEISQVRANIAELFPEEAKKGM